jgi:hypothetical protein
MSNYEISRLTEWLEYCGLSKAVVQVDGIIYLIAPGSVQPVASDDKSINVYDFQRIQVPEWLENLIREQSHWMRLRAERHQKNLQKLELLLRTNAIVRHTYDAHKRQAGEETYLDIVVTLAEECRSLQELLLELRSRDPGRIALTSPYLNS